MIFNGQSTQKTLSSNNHKNNSMKTYLTFILLMTCLLGIAQTTAIPDNNFEQALIDLGIDSDGAINGQVLTADITNVVNLDVSNKGIYDLTGIEDFTSLENLNVSDNYLSTLDLSGNVLLEELYCSNPADDLPNMDLMGIDLSTNPNIHTITAQYLGLLDVVNLKNGNNMNMVPLHLDFSWPSTDPPDIGIINDLCIQVDDENAAQQNQYPYSAWTILDSHVTYSFSENCSLGIKTSLQESIQIFPNPVHDFLNIQSPDIQLKKIEVYNLQGQQVKSVSKNLEQVDMQFLSSGIYFVKFYGNKGFSVKKIVKK